jgi:hypothetical protein
VPYTPIPRVGLESSPHVRESPTVPEFARNCTPWLRITQISAPISPWPDQRREATGLLLFGCRICAEMTNTLWIAANLIFDLDTGKTSNVLMLVNQESDATIFKDLSEGQKYLSFVQVRAGSIQWFLDPPIPQRPQGYVIRGVQIT